MVRNVFLFLFSILFFSSSNAFAQNFDCRGADYPVHLTFDDGPSLAITPLILDTLKKFRITATFFINTNKINEKNLPRYRALIIRAKSEGHTIGFHTVDHIDHVNLNYDEAAILENMKVPQELSDLMSPYIRFPYGQGWFRERNLNLEIRRRWVMDQAHAMGFQHIGWDMDTWDWSKDNRLLLPNSLQNQICSQQGGIVLMHDIQAFTGAQLENMIIMPTLKMGHHFVDLNTIIALNGKKEQSWPSLQDAVVGAKYCFGKQATFHRYYDQVRLSCDQIPDHGQEQIVGPN